MTATIRAAEPRDEPRWRELWDAYTRFYEREPAELLTRHTWQRILDPRAPIFALVAEISLPPGGGPGRGSVHRVAEYVSLANGPLTLHEAIALSRVASDGYIWLVPMVSPFAAFSTK